MKRFSKKKSEDLSNADFEIADSDDEAAGEEEVEDDEPGYKVHDEPDQVAFDAPVKYTSVKKGAIRIRSEMESDKIPRDIKKGEIIEVTHTKEVVTESGIKVTRLRFKRGWTSLVNSTGTSTLMVAESDTNKHWKVVSDTCKVRKEQAWDSDDAGFALKKNDVVRQLACKSAAGQKKNVKDVKLLAPTGEEVWVSTYATPEGGKRLALQLTVEPTWKKYEDQRVRDGKAAGEDDEEEGEEGGEGSALSKFATRFSSLASNVPEGMPDAAKDAIAAALKAVEAAVAGAEEGEPPEPEPEA